jgi:hypothetical protein
VVEQASQSTRLGAFHVLALLLKMSVYLPSLYLPVAALLFILLIETWFKRDQAWALPAAVLYLTIGAWYFADLFISPENYDQLPEESLNLGYGQVAWFLVVYRSLTPLLSARLTTNAHERFRSGLTAETLFAGAVVLWLALLSYGVNRMNGDLMASLFPLDARAGIKMWQRAAGADAGETGFLVSAASHMYVLVCASFGTWLFFLRSAIPRCLAVTLMAISWPYFLLSGTRNIFLAVSLPFFMTYLIFGRHQWWLRLTCLLAAFFMLNTAFLVVISHRNVGFRALFERDYDNQMIDPDFRHRGLNMMQELCFANDFTRVNGPAYGARYLDELLNVVPRAIWPSKPLLGIDYSAWRGYEGGNSDIAVTATISSGLIGGGVLNFGTLCGPLVSALLMSTWAGLLARWWSQRDSLLRYFLFIAGFGLTFNLGRDITLLVLWPIVFGYLITRVIELITYQQPSDTQPIAATHIAKRIASTRLM